MDSKNKKFLAIFVGMALFFAIGFLTSEFRSRHTQNIPETKPVSVPQTVTWEGEYVCLPHKNTNGPQTMECAIGMKTSDGKFYALDMSKMTATTTSDFISSGMQIIITGALVPKEQEQARQSNYDVSGIIQVETLRIETVK